MRKDPKPENLAKLTREQREVFDKWQEEGDKADTLMQSLLDALAVNDKIECARLANELDRLIPATCEHGRSVYLSCIACTEIEKTLFPEAYDADGNRIENELYIDTIVSLPKSDKMLN